MREAREESGVVTTGTRGEQGSADEKLARRLAALRVPEVGFVSAEAEEAYAARAERLIDAITLEKVPDRVPVMTSTGFYPGRFGGLTPFECMREPERAWQAWISYNLEFQPDVMVMPSLHTLPAEVFELLDYRLYKWPGHGLPHDSGYQYNEQEYMMVEEYDEFIADPTDYILRTYLPRVVGAYEGFGRLVPPGELTSLAFSPRHIASWAEPKVLESLEKVTAAGRRMAEWRAGIAGVQRRLLSEGLPVLIQSSTHAPFDYIGDTFRGTRGILLDMLRDPELVIEACDRLAPLMVKWVVENADPTAAPGVFIPLHKGADGFMSLQQFEIFYWPSLRRVVLGLIEAGFIPWLFAEGRYDSRLEAISDVPPGRTVWRFDQTDMGRAKEVLGSVSCITGNVPLSLAHAGSSEEVFEYCRHLVECVGMGGGYILDFGAGPDTAKPENIHAMVRAAKEYGRVA